MDVFLVMIIAVGIGITVNALLPSETPTKPSKCSIHKWDSDMVCAVCKFDPQLEQLKERLFKRDDEFKG